MTASQVTVDIVESHSIQLEEHNCRPTEQIDTCLGCRTCTIILCSHVQALRR